MRGNVWSCRDEVRLAYGRITAEGAGIKEVMSSSPSRRFPVTVTHLPVTRCQFCPPQAAGRTAI
jgi:hypothetical protein